MKEYILGGLLGLLCVAFLVGAWKFSRWFNWEFSYSAEMDHRIELIETRLQILEKKT